LIKDNDRNYENYNRENRGNINQDRSWWDRTSDEVSSWFGDEDAERRRRMDEQRKGEHRGKGPKQYQRSQERILEDVCDRLSDDDRLDASDIEVKVNGSEVVLSGTVDSKNAKRRAEDIAEAVSGVANVQNQLRVSQQSFDSSKQKTMTQPTSGNALKPEKMHHN
jgi:osmotically-inducible protein OsmY